jgi:hypothetical protein
MRIDARPAGPLAGTAPAIGRPRSGAAFSLAEAGRGREATKAGAAAPLATLDAILMLQGEDDPRERRRRSARRGQDLLDALDRLKAGLLAGTVPADDLAGLADRVAAAAAPSGDPSLDAIVAAIALRAQVELAKLAQR